jgi:hypothetical protein
VLEGKFHPIGGSWVENDANMPSGKVLAWQLIYGQRYFQSCFGSRSRVAWLPDSFGLTGVLPQIICGVTCGKREVLELSLRAARWCLADTKDISVFRALARRLYYIYLADTKDIY